VFISYRHTEPDQSLAKELANAIGKQHQVFIDTQIPLGKEWGATIEEHLTGADFLVALVSKEAAESPMVVAEIEQAHFLNVHHKRPGIIPIRLMFDGHLRYPLSAYLNRFQQGVWNGPQDTPRVTALVLTALQERAPTPQPADQRRPGRWAGPVRGLGQRSRAVRPPGQSADPRRTGPLRRQLAGA